MNTNGIRQFTYDHQIMTQVTFVAYGAHPLFLITLNFVNFLLVGLIVEVRFSGFLVKNPSDFHCVALFEAWKKV